MSLANTQATVSSINLHHITVQPFYFINMLVFSPGSSWQQRNNFKQRWWFDSVEKGAFLVNFNGKNFLEGFWISECYPHHNKAKGL